MPHGPTARFARGDDLPRVVELLRLARSDSPLGPQFCSPDSQTIGDQLTVWCAMPGTHLIVADTGDDLVGVALVQHVEANLFSDIAYLQIEALFVDASYRRRGVGRSLMYLAAHVATENGDKHVVTMPMTGHRSEQRFLSGLGFTPAATRRVAETTSLRRRLEVLATPRRGKGIDELIARRRRSRGLPPTPVAGIAVGATGHDQTSSTRRSG